MERQNIKLLINANCTKCYIRTYILEERLIKSQRILNKSLVYTMRKLTLTRSRMTNNIYPAFHYRKWMIECNFSKIQKRRFPAKYFECVHKHDSKMQMKNIILMFCFAFYVYTCNVPWLFNLHVNQWSRWPTVRVC